MNDALSAHNGRVRSEISLGAYWTRCCSTGLAGEPVVHEIATDFVCYVTLSPRHDRYQRTMLGYGAQCLVFLTTRDQDDRVARWWVQ